MEGTAIKSKDLAVCATCPWRKNLQGTKHPAGWYKLANITRLWNGIRSGNAPGMVCHSSDPDSKDYGSVKTVPETVQKRECAGAIQLVITEINLLNDIGDFKIYKKSRKSPLTRAGLRAVMERVLFRGSPSVIQCDDVSLPWDQNIG